MLIIAATFDLRDPVWQFWFGMFSLVLAAIAITISIWTYYKQKQNKLLTYQLETDVRLVSVQRDHGENIKIFLDNDEIDDARLLVIKFMNSGNTPVTVSDYDAPSDPSIRFRFQPHTIIRYGVQETSDPTGIPRDQMKDKLNLDADKHTIALSPLPLNPGEWIKIKVLTRGKVDMKVYGHLSGGNIKQFITPKPRLGWRSLIGVGLACIIAGFLISNGIGVMSAFFQGRCTFGSASISGSSAFYSIVNEEAQNYLATCPVVSLSVNESTSASGLRDIEDDRIQIADSELPASSLNLTDLVDHRVAVIVFALIINKGVTGVTNLSTQQIRNIYDGTYTNWDQIGGPNLHITVYDRPYTSGTHNAFVRSILGGNENPLPAGSVVTDRTDQVVQSVAQKPGAIGYVDVGTAYAASTTVTTVEIDQHAPSISLVENNVYQFWAIEHMYTKGNPDSLSSSFITYVINNIKTNETFIRLQDMSPTILAMHT